MYVANSMSAAEMKYMPMISGIESLHVASLVLVAATLGGLAHFGRDLVHNCIFLLLITFQNFLGVTNKSCQLGTLLLFLIALVR